MPGRLIAIGDIHGCDVALERLIDLIQPQPSDTLVTLGDYVNRGPNSCGVLDLLEQLQQHCRLVCLMGNHDEALLAQAESRRSPDGLPRRNGEGVELFPEHHFSFLRTCRHYYETEHHLFVHASYDPQTAMSQQEPFTLVWQRPRECWPQPHVSGKTAILGHTPQRNGEVLDLGHLVCIDTWCWGGGWLTGLDVESRMTWQVDLQGNVRRPSV